MLRLRINGLKDVRKENNCVRKCIILHRIKVDKYCLVFGGKIKKNAKLSAKYQLISLVTSPKDEGRESGWGILVEVPGCTLHSATHGACLLGQNLKSHKIRLW